ncbi:MAG: PD-(D/E)XK nuclease family protein, partial [Planctomycetes bacterium]|nr:PD-(D/E)XK nuclease family protein [Planctomycetota bacterium]
RPGGAAEAGAGGRVRDGEATPKGAPLVGGDDRPLPVIGRGDRVDVHPQLGWRLLDYRTGDKVKKPELSHRRGDRWIDLQLPLYALLAPGLGVDGSLADGRLALGYLALPASAEPETLLLASWEPEQLEDAYSAARQVVRAIRAGQLFELGDDPPRDPQIAAIAGLGLLGAEADEEDEA